MLRPFFFTVILFSSLQGRAQTAATQAAAATTITEAYQISPTFPGGINAFTKYVEGNLNATENGNMYVRFVVETNGKLSNIEIVKSINKETDDRLIQLLEKCPEWTPGYIGTETARMRYLYPIFVTSVGKN